MYSAPALTLLSVICVSLLSLLGILFFLFESSFIEGILLYLVSLSTGALLGDVFIHILPDLSEDAGFFAQAMFVILGGILFSFIVEKFIHWRHCHVMTHDHDHEGHCHPVGILSLIGESLHNFIDGVVIAAAFLASIPVGIATTIAVVFHEIPHEIGNFAILLHSGYTKKRALLFNCLSAAASILGAVFVLIMSSSLDGVVKYMLPFAAGNLLYIAGSDLIPELHKQTKIGKSLIQLIFMLVGMGFMYLVLFLE